MPGPVTIRVDDRSALVFHPLLGRPRLLDFTSVSERDRFLSLVKVGRVRTGDPAVDTMLSVADSTARELVGLRNEEYLKAYAKDVRFLSLLVAENCNLGCSYCIAGANIDSARTGRTTRMPWEVARTSLKWFASRALCDDAVLNFSGGEPLLNWTVVASSVEYVASAFPRLAESLKLSINTNATLITPEIAHFLAAHDFAVATSLDGTPEGSDLVRITRKGRLGVSQQILAGWDLLADAGLPVDGFMATFNDRNYEQLNRSVIDFAVERGCRWVRVDCDVIHLLDRPVAETADRLWEVYEAGRDAGIAVEGFWSTPAKNLINPDYPMQVPFFCGAVSGETVSVHPDGRLSACGFSRGDLGRVSSDGLERDFAAHIALVAAHLPGAREFCRGCDIEGFCAGGCNIALEEAAAVGSDAAVRYNCELYREMTRRLLPRSFEAV